MRNVMDLVLATVGSFRGWIYWICRWLVEAMCDLVLLEMVSWSHLELTATLVLL